MAEVFGAKLPALVQIVRDCWADAPRDRPNTNNIVKRLQEIEANRNDLDEFELSVILNAALNVSEKPLAYKVAAAADKAPPEAIAAEPSDHTRSF